MNSRLTPNRIAKLLLVAVGWLVGICALSVAAIGSANAQTPDYDAQKVQQEIEQLQRLLELRQQLAQSEGAEQGGQGTQGSQEAQGRQGTQGAQSGNTKGRPKKGSVKEDYRLSEQATARTQGAQGAQGARPGSAAGTGAASGVTGAAGTGAVAMAGAGAAGTAPQTGPVTLKPIDTGVSVVTFSIGGASKTYNKYAVKTNLLYAATMTPNLGFDYGLGDKTTIGITAGYNPWGNFWEKSGAGPDWDPNNLYKRRADHIAGSVEFRYWLDERFKGHFAGANLLFANYIVGEVGLNTIVGNKPIFENRDQNDGIVYGGGVTYGYLWELSPKWGVEFTIGAGIAVFEYDRQRIELGEYGGISLTDPSKIRKTYIGPTSAGITLVLKL